LSSLVSIDVLRVLQGTIVILGLIIIYYAAKGYRKAKNKSLLFLAFGFLFVTIGAIVAGLIFEFLDPQDFLLVDEVEAVCEVVGFVLIVYSIVGVKG
jgi:hypothetical protein